MAPLRDYRCPNCGKEKIDQFVPREHRQLCECGEEMRTKPPEDVSYAPIENNHSSFRPRHAGYRRTTKKSTSS